jgi:2-polyprenyl-6-methoxyphenol hydroxylase-like FAD-dependent oxidoreductase
MTTTHHDVVVVGARSGGAATALLLARSGLRVLVLDRSAYGSDTLSTHALMRGGVVQLHRWGLLDRVVASGTPPIRQTTFDYGTEQVTVSIKSAGGVDALYAPRRTVLDPILVDAASEAGATFRFGVSVTDLVHGPDGRVLGVRARARDGRRVEHRARWVVGADGIRSVIARGGQAPVLLEGLHAAPAVYGYWSDLPAQGYEWVFRPGWSTGIIPTSDGQVCVFAGGGGPLPTGGRAALEAWYRAALDAAGPRLAARLEAATPPTALRAFPGVRGHLRQPWGPGWALVGDAGFFRDPITAHGITDALRDAELLATALLAEIGGTEPEHEALAGYQARRDPLAERFLHVSDEIATYTWTQAEVMALHRRLSGALADEVEVLQGLPEPGAARAAA